MAVTVAGIPPNTAPTMFAYACIVGKQHSDGSGGNTYPATCNYAFHGDIIWGPTVDPNYQGQSYPTIISQTGYLNGPVWMHGTWWGLWP
jgi:hypothetical protein